MPSNIGGAHWGGVADRSGAAGRRRSGEPHRGDGAADSARGIRSASARAEARQRLGDDYEYNMMRGTPYVMRRRLLLAPSRLPCTPPPFGALVAIDLKTGERQWEVPLGSMRRR